MNKLKRIVIGLIISLGFVAPTLVPVVATAQNIQKNVCKGANLDATQSTDNCANTTKNAAGTVNKLIANVINVLSFVVGVVCVIMIIIGGFKYVTSGGEAGSVTSAKNTILYALIGLVIVAMAQIIVKFVLGRVTSI